MTRYKQMIVESAAKDIIYSNHFTGVHGNYLIPSIVAAGLRPAGPGHLGCIEHEFRRSYRGQQKSMARYLGLRQGIGAVKAIMPVAQLVARLGTEYRTALARLATAG